MASEKIFVTGASGDIGRKVVYALLEKKIPVTVYVRDVQKSKELFKDNELVSVVEGDYDNLDNLEKAMPGHTRLFLMCADLPRMPIIKPAIASIAYKAGVKQIVDLSSRFTMFPWRTSVIGEAHRLAEERVYALALEHNANFVALRPSRFFTNHLWADIKMIKEQNTLFDTQDADAPIEWVSTDDIAEVGAHVLSDAIENHANFAYPLISDSVTHAQRAEIFSKALGRTIEYKQVPPAQRYRILQGVGLPAPMAYDLSTVDTCLPPTTVVNILLNRPNKTLEDWVVAHKDHFSA
ncbi:hypothetical protein BC940DRAFT_65785 [Gongronella butleri]|nr:hypothetical protein BC940DRAFT_65785 [Gongronella butleri]